MAIRIKGHAAAWTVAAAVAVGTVVRLPFIPGTIYDGFGFRQAQTAYLVREFMRGGFAVDSPLPVLGPPWTLPMEFPLFQGIAALVGTVAHLDPGFAARVTGLAFFQAVVVLTVVACVRWYSWTTAVIVAVLMEAVPYGVMWGWSALIDFASVAFTLGSLLLLDRFVMRGRWPWLLAVGVALAAAFLVKPTTAVPWLLVYAAVLVQHPDGSKPRVRTIGFGSIPVAAAVLVTFAWTAYADAVKQRSPYAREFLLAASDHMRQWNFGTLGQRLDVDTWLSILDTTSAMAGSLLLWLAAFVVCIAIARPRLMSISIALVPLAAYLTFTNLHAVHDYYQIAVFPAVVMAVAIAITELTARLPSIRPGWLLPLVLTFVVVFFAWIGSYGLAVAETIGRPMPEPELSHVIDRFVPTGSGVIVVGCDWDPQVLYGADRRGLALPGVASHVPIPIEWIPSELSYLAFCNDLMQPTDGDPASILPPSIIAERLDRGIYRLSR